MDRPLTEISLQPVRSMPALVMIVVTSCHPDALRTNPPTTGSTESPKVTATTEPSAFMPPALAMSQPAPGVPSGVKVPLAALCR